MTPDDFLWWTFCTSIQFRHGFLVLAIVFSTRWVAVTPPWIPPDVSSLHSRGNCLMEQQECRYRGMRWKISAMKEALIRLTTYKLYPTIRKVFVIQLANNGFRYQPALGAVSCEFCGGGFCKWAAGLQGASKSHVDGCQMMRGDTATQHTADTIFSPGNISVISPVTEVQSFQKPLSIKTNIKNVEKGKIGKFSAPSIAAKVFENGSQMFPFPFSEKGQNYMLSDLSWMYCIRGIRLQKFIVAPATPDVPLYPDMLGVLHRLRTFAGRPLDNVAVGNLPSRIAAEGFFSDPQTRVIRCYNCGTLFNDDPTQRRAAHPPPGQHCDQTNFVFQQQQYFAAPQAPLHQLGVHLRARDHYMGVPTGARAVTEQQSLLQMGVTPRSQNAGYLSLDLRRDSYRLHPRSGVDYGDLAKAGFYAVDRSHVSCFNCGLVMGLAEFGQGVAGISDMLSLHLQRRPACSFARHELQAEEIRTRSPHQHPEASRGVASGEASRPSTSAGEQTTPGSQPRGLCRFCPNPADVIFLPCRHLIVCHRCTLRHTGGRRCSVCRQIIRGTLRVFR